jgi:hypothetical protein
MFIIPNYLNLRSSLRSSPTLPFSQFSKPILTENIVSHKHYFPTQFVAQIPSINTAFFINNSNNAISIPPSRRRMFSILQPIPSHISHPASNALLSSPPLSLPLIYLNQSLCPLFAIFCPNMEILLELELELVELPADADEEDVQTKRSVCLFVRIRRSKKWKGKEERDQCSCEA